MGKLFDVLIKVFKTASKHLICFIILLIVGILTSIAYGIFIGGELSIYYYIFQFVTLTAISLFFVKNGFNKNIVSEIVETMITVGLVIFISFASYGAINDISGELVAEYDAKVTDTYYSKTSNELWFVDSQGKEGRVFYSLEFLEVFIEEGEYPETGDTVHIKEYNGIFDVTYYKLESWENTNKYN